MKQELNDKNLEQVIGGSVIVSGNEMVVAFTTLRKKCRLINCESYEAILLATQMYGEYRTKGDLAFENAVMEAFRANGWIK